MKADKKYGKDMLGCFLFRFKWHYISKQKMRLTSLQALFSGKKTVLHNLHLEHKGKMVEFAGYNMPVQYPTGIIKEHEHCRSSASIFDVSHMGQIIISGADRLKLLERTTVGSTQRRTKDGINECYLTMFLNEEAGIIDDAIACIQDQESQIRIVANAGNKYTVMDHFINVSRKETLEVRIKLEENLGLVALQGPKAASVLQKLITDFDLAKAPFMSTFKAKINGAEHVISRSGYTGEDGFEISGNEAQINWLTEALLKDEDAKLAGLGARDTLRIEAGLCLHGHEMSQTITPFEANLMWTVYKKGERKRELFIGEQQLRAIVQDNKAGVRKDRKRVGFALDGSGIIRENCRIYTEDEKEIGITTSGTFSPIFKKCIGMAYVDQGYHTEGNKMYAVQRDKKYPLTVKKMPFIKPGYYKSWRDVPE